MAQKFPKYRLHTAEPIAYEEINHNLRSVRDELGRLNEHNITLHAFSSRTQAEPDFAIHLNNDWTEFNPFMNFGDGTANGQYPAETAVSPAPYADDRISIDGSSEWQTVLTFEKFTANSLLWVLFSFQQQTYGPAAGINPGGQYAIRIDGSIISETLTGGLDRANDPVGSITSCQAFPYVLDLILPVIPGNHTIELVGRAMKNTLVAWLQPEGDNYTMVFNREVIILTLDPDSEAVEGIAGDFTPIEEGNTINAAVTSAPFDDVAADYNDIEYADIQPESLTGVHCPTTVLDADQALVGTLVTSTYTNTYPGFSTDTMGSPGWAVIDDGTDQLNMAITDVDMTDTALGGVLVGMDVNVIQIYPDPTATTTSELTYCIIALQFRDENGAWHTIGKTERYVNSEYDDDLAAQLVLRKNIGFRTLLTIDDLDGFTEITGLRGVVSGFDRSNSATFTIELQQASLWYAVMQGGT